MKNEKYTSSIINNYGDMEKVSQDCKAIFEIMSRQGSSLLINCIAESVGITANKFKLSVDDRDALLKNLISELQNALNERL